MPNGSNEATWWVDTVNNPIRFGKTKLSEVKLMA